METQWETKNKSKAEEKRHILFFVCLEGAGVDTALYAPCITRRTQGRKIYTCQKSCCCCCCATPANSARSDQVVTYSKRLDPDTRRTKHIVAICGACQTECYALSITHSNNTGAMLLRVGVIIIFYRRREQVRSVGSGRCEMKQKGSDSCCCSSFTTCRTY